MVHNIITAGNIKPLFVFLRTFHPKEIAKVTIMHPEIKKAQREITAAFNTKPKSGIQKIRDLCKANDIASVEAEIADFFHQQKQNLDLEAVGDYLGSEENNEVLAIFTEQINLKGQSFAEGLRNYLKTFKLPGEAQKIDRFVECFSKIYYQQNPGGNIANQDAAYLLAFQTIMLNTDLHNPSILERNKMDMKGLIRNLRGCNNGTDFDEPFLQQLYDEIKKKPFELNFVKTAPGYELTSSTLNQDPTFKKLDLLLHSSKVNAQDIFPGVGDHIRATVDKPKSWLHNLTGYAGTITLIDEKTQEKLATIQVYKPSFISKWLFGEEPKVAIQPAHQDENSTQMSIEVAAKITASFQSTVSSIKATYDYVKSDLQEAYEQQKILATQSSPTNTADAFKTFKQTLGNTTQRETPGADHDSVTPMKGSR